VKVDLKNELHKSLIICLESLLIVLTGTGIMQAQQVTYSGSLQFATGSYFFTESTESFYFVNGLSLSGDIGRLSLNIPYVIQNSPWISYNQKGGIPTGGTQHGEIGGRRSDVSSMQDMTRQRRHRVDLPDTVSYRSSSFSDPTVGGTLFLYGRTSPSTSVNLNTTLKIPLANPENGFGTGAWDFGAGLSILQRIKTFYLYGDITYMWLGNMDELELNNPFFFSAGISRGFGGGRWMISTSFSTSIRIIDDYDPPMSLHFGFGHFISPRSSVSSTVGFGLSESSSDFSAGLGWSLRL
jgi:hypothetical protein